VPRHVIDLSQKISTNLPVFYSATGLSGLAHQFVITADTYEGTGILRTYGRIKELYRTCFISMSDHASTHIDAVYHINAHGDTIDRMPLDTLCGEAVILDYCDKKPITYDPLRPLGDRIIGGDWITVESLEQAAKKVGGIKEGDIVLIRTDGYKKIPSWEYCHSIVPLRVEGLKWLLNQGIKVIGIDQPSIDIPPDYPHVHNTFRETNWFHFENLANLDKIPVSRFRMVCYPLKWEGGSGSPVRVLAVIGEVKEKQSHNKLYDLSYMIPEKPVRQGWTKQWRSIIVSWDDIHDTRIQETKQLCFSDHVQTHVDAPAHFDPKGKCIDQISPQFFLERDVVLIDLSHKKPGESITKQDLAEMEIRPDDVPIIYTGISKMFSQMEKHIIGFPPYSDYIVPFSVEAVEYLVKEKGVKMFGIDEDEIDADQNMWPAHNLQKKYEFCIIENLKLFPAVLELPKRFRLTVIPLSIDGGTASPVRAVASVE
jgi:kynurenine formamidase